MSIHIIIDGYNLIRQSTTLSTSDQQDIMLGREALLDMLAAYRKIKPHRITVVFDGHNSPVFSPQRNRQKGISLRFSRSGESADEVIKRMAHREREKALVVSSDRDVAGGHLSHVHLPSTRQRPSDLCPASAHQRPVAASSSAACSGTART